MTEQNTPGSYESIPDEGQDGIIIEPGAEGDQDAGPGAGKSIDMDNLPDANPEAAENNPTNWRDDPALWTDDTGGMGAGEGISAEQQLRDDTEEARYEDGSEQIPPEEPTIGEAASDVDFFDDAVDPDALDGSDDSAHRGGDPLDDFGS